MMDITVEKLVNLVRGCMLDALLASSCHVYYVVYFFFFCSSETSVMIGVVIVVVILLFGAHHKDGELRHVSSIREFVLSLPGL